MNATFAKIFGVTLLLVAAFFALKWALAMLLYTLKVVVIALIIATVAYIIYKIVRR